MRVEARQSLRRLVGLLMLRMEVCPTSDSQSGSTQGLSPGANFMSSSFKSLILKVLDTMSQEVTLYVYVFGLSDVTRRFSAYITT